LRAFCNELKWQVIEFREVKGVRFAELPLLQLQIVGLSEYAQISRCASPYRNLELGGNMVEPELLGGLFLLAGEKTL
jgi:hypothetical protein